ncbi:MAG: hypothetical protein E6767_07175 [Dysgonomonas sp.]|nr:hypothetical protein [Dysgonomonas sp.]
MILFFNPGHEVAVLNASPYYMVPANVLAMQQELSFLPAWYGNENDIVLLSKQPDKAYCSYLSSLFNLLPKPITEDEIPSYPNNEISIWGISPQVIHFFEELDKKYNLDFNIPKWEKDYTYLNNRQVARDCLKELIDAGTGISKNILPTFFSKLEDIESFVLSTPLQLLAKAPYSSSGRGLLWLPETGLTRTERQILHGILKKQGSVSIEPVLNKKVDFAMEFMSDGKGNIDFEGYSLFYTNKKGAYIGNYIGSQKSIVDELTQKIELSLLEEAKEKLISILKTKYASLYKGCIGVDMMIYKQDEEYHLHPCLEINKRYNMGYLALHLFEKYISEKSQGRFYIDFSSKNGEIYHQHCDMEKQYPIQIENGRIIKGYLSLCAVNENSKYRAYVLIDEPSS